MNIFDVEMKILNTEVFPHHNIADLNSRKTSLCFDQLGETFTVKGNNHPQLPSQLL